MRIVFLVFVVITTCYFFWVNDKKETFTQTTVIEDIYMELYNRKPSPKELQFYSDYASQNPNITKAQLKDVIASTSPTMAKSLAEPSAGTLSKDPEQVVIEAYNEVLARMPTPSEMKKYINVGYDRLIMILMSTDEYARLQKTQTNTVYANISGDATDRQVTMIIEDLNKEVTGSSYVDPDTMGFYKKKFLEMNHDRDKFRQFLNQITYGKTTPATSQATTPAAGQAPAPAAATATSQAPTPAKSQAPAPGSQSKTDTQGVSYNNSTIYNIYTVGKTDYMGMPNKALIQDLSANNQTTTDVVKDISCQKGTINTNTADSFSTYVDTRNKEELKSICARNTKFQDFEDDEYAAVFYTKEDMVLDPSLRWSVPQKRAPVCAPNARCGISSFPDQTSLIGTPLDQASDTKWGSILPTLPPK